MKVILQIRVILENEYELLYKHMKRDFPANELAPFFVIKSNLEKKIYYGFFLTLTVNDASETLIGYVIITAPEGESGRFALINYFAVLPDYRSKGNGSEFLKMLNGFYPERSFVVEVDDPSVAKNIEFQTEALRRIKFYEQAGFHILPTYKAKIFGADMIIMSNISGDVGSARKIMHDLYIPALGSKQWLRFIDVREV